MSNLHDRGTLKGMLQRNSGNYNDLINKSAINGHTLIGNQSGHALGLANEDDIIYVEANPLEPATADLHKILVDDTIYSIPDVVVYGTASGAIASFDDGGDNKPLKSLKVAINPVQDLHGYDSPWVGGAGKNKLKVTATSQTIAGVTFTVNDDGTIKVNGTATADAKFVTGEYILKAGSSVRLNGSPVDGSNSTIALGYQGYGIVSAANSDRVCDRTSASTDWDNDIYIKVTSGYTANNLTFKPMIRLASVTDATFAPYSNICPISGWTEVNVTVADDVENPTVSNVYTIDLDGTRYGGKLDVTSGVLTVTHANIASYNGESINEPWISSEDAYESGATPTTGAQVVYPLTTPLTVQLTPTQINSLLGNNNIWSDTGEIVECVYQRDLNIALNKALNQ